MEYVPADTRFLAEWLALRLPYPEEGGRQGNGVYKELVNNEVRPSHVNESSALISSLRIPNGQGGPNAIAGRHGAPTIRPIGRLLTT